MTRLFQFQILLSIWITSLSTIQAEAQSPLVIYNDQLVNGFQDWSYTMRDFANPSPTHAGGKSIAVTPTNNYGAISFHHTDLDTTAYTNFSFWINGGTNGGQLLQVYAELSEVSQGAYLLPSALVSNTWQQFTDRKSVV